MDTKHGLCLVWLCFSSVPRQERVYSSADCNAVKHAEFRVLYLYCGGAVVVRWLGLLFTKVLPVRSVDHPVCGGKHVAVELFVVFQSCKLHKYNLIPLQCVWVEAEISKPEQ